MPTPKRIVGTSRSAIPAKDALGGGQGEARVLVARERPGPGVEELHGSRAVGDLGAKERDGDLGKPLEEQVEELGFARASAS